MRWIVVFALVSSLCVHGVLSWRIAKQTKDIAVLDEQIVRMRQVVDEVQALEHQAHHLRAQLVPLEKLDAARRGPHCFLQTINRALVEAAADLYSLHEAGGWAVVRITTRDNNDISTFMRRLQSTSGIFDVGLRFNIPDTAWEYSYGDRFGAQVSMRVDYSHTCDQSQ
jgi:Tfp pilus assembly protein PilN